MFYSCPILKQKSTLNSAIQNFKKLKSEVVSRLQTDKQTEVHMKLKVKQSCYKPGIAQSIPGS